MAQSLTTSNGSPAAAPLYRSPSAGVRYGDKIYGAATFIAALSIFVIIIWIAFDLWHASALSIRAFGFDYVKTSDWDETRDVYGILPFIFGTLYSSFIALVLAVPVSIGAAIFLSELAPTWIRTPTTFLIELLAAIPSVVYGLWGIFVMIPILRDHVMKPISHSKIGSFFLFQGTPIGPSMFAAGVILAIMITPYITAITRDILRAIPKAQREGSYALGATKWETISKVVLPYAKSGIIGAVILGLGRALGETMAVTMVIGNQSAGNGISWSLFDPGYTMASALANKFNEAAPGVNLSSLVEIGLVLFVVAVIVNIFARLLVFNSAGGGGDAERVGTIALGVVGALIGLRLLAFAITVPADRIILLDVVLVVAAVAAIAAAGRWLMARVLTIARLIQNAVMLSLCTVGAMLAVSVLGMVLVFLVTRGFSALSLHFFTQLPNHTDEKSGGMAQSIFGTLVLLGLASTIGLPFGILGGIYQVEARGRFAAVVRFFTDVLNGIPSIVIGIFVYAVAVLPVAQAHPGSGFSAYAGGFALGIMMIPTVMRTTEEILRLVPFSMREASLGLGATRWRTMWSVVLPAARGGIITGVMLALARIAGETAPLLFTILGNEFIQTRRFMGMNVPKLDVPIDALPLRIYNYATAVDPEQNKLAWAGALVLISMILIFSVAARFATRTNYMEEK